MRAIRLLLATALFSGFASVASVAALGASVPAASADPPNLPYHVLVDYVKTGTDALFACVTVKEVGKRTCIAIPDPGIPPANIAGDYVHVNVTSAGPNLIRVCVTVNAAPPGHCQTI